MVAIAEPATADIVLVRDRDAQAAIRGFVYQIEFTIQRWLTLAPDDALMPERAEDIDLIANWMAGGDDQLLEQIKHLTTSVTLNSPSVRAALAGFREIAAANPGRSLRFRFASNGAPTKERPAVFPGRLGGQLWPEHPGRCNLLLLVQNSAMEVGLKSSIRCANGTWPRMPCAPIRAGTDPPRCCSYVDGYTR